MKCTCDLKGYDLQPSEDGTTMRFHIKLVKCQLCEAAPELLEAAKLLIAQVEKSGGMAMETPPYKTRFDRLKAAIKKAEKH